MIYVSEHKTRDVWLPNKHTLSFPKAYTLPPGLPAALPKENGLVFLNSLGIRLLSQRTCSVEKKSSTSGNLVLPFFFHLSVFNLEWGLSIPLIL